MDGFLRATLQCPHDRRFDAGSPERGSSCSPSTPLHKTPPPTDACQGPAWPLLPCSDRLPRKSATIRALRASACAVFIVSDFSSARSPSLNVRGASCRTAITFSVPATPSILAQRRKSNANLRLRTCGSGHWPRRLFEPKVMLRSLNAHYSTPTIGCLSVAARCKVSRRLRSGEADALRMTGASIGNASMPQEPRAYTAGSAHSYMGSLERQSENRRIDLLDWLAETLGVHLSEGSVQPPRGATTPEGLRLGVASRRATFQEEIALLRKSDFMTTQIGSGTASSRMRNHENRLRRCSGSVDVFDFRLQKEPARSTRAGL